MQSQHDREGTPTFSGPLTINPFRNRGNLSNLLTGGRKLSSGRSTQETGLPINSYMFVRHNWVAWHEEQSKWYQMLKQITLAQPKAATI